MVEWFIKKWIKSLSVNNSKLLDRHGNFLNDKKSYSVLTIPAKLSAIDLTTWNFVLKKMSKWFAIGNGTRYTSQIYQ